MLFISHHEGNLIIRSQKQAACLLFFRRMVWQFQTECGFAGTVRVDALGKPLKLLQAMRGVFGFTPCGAFLRLHASKFPKRCKTLGVTPASICNLVRSLLRDRGISEVTVTTSALI